MCHHGGCYRKIGMKLMVGCLASSGHQRGISQPANVCCLESEVVVFFMPRDQQQQIHWSGHGICGLSTIQIDMLLISIVNLNIDFYFYFEINPAKKTNTSKKVKKPLATRGLGEVYRLHWLSARGLRRKDGAKQTALFIVPKLGSKVASVHMFYPHPPSEIFRNGYQKVMGCKMYLRLQIWLFLGYPC